MKISISKYEAADILLADNNASWSYPGALALCEHLEELEGELGEEIALDTVALRCEWREYETAVEAAEDTGWEYEGDDEDDEDAKEDAARTWLSENTSILEFKGGVVVRTEF